MNALDENRREADELSRMLSELPHVDPPATLVRDVMTSVQASAARPVDLQTQSMRRGTMAKKALWILAAAAAVVLVLLRLTGYPPVEKGTEATIGAAERYQAQQISTADVKTDNADLQAFMQSDLFHKLATDKAAREALRNPDFQRALADGQVRAALARPEVIAAIASLKVDASAGLRPEAVQLLAARLDAGPRVAFEAAIQASPALVHSLVAPGVAQAIASSSPLATALARPDAALALSQNAVVNALMNASANASADAAANAAAGASAGAVSH
jgi:hypothetical protein